MPRKIRRASRRNCPKVTLSFAIQEPQAPGDASGTVIEQYNRACGKLATAGTPFFETIAQVGVEQHEAVPFYHGKSV
jgi:hypothetical protein